MRSARTSWSSPRPPARRTTRAASAFGLLMGRRNLSGSLIGGIPETQEMLDFCGAQNITADVEVIPIQQVHEAYDLNPA
jgi:uncharacterized zinc-type alcohol dehydrogenase-like protein